MLIECVWGMSDSISVVDGVLSPVRGYYGTVENQGRGSLHLHMLIWLDHKMTPGVLRNNVRDATFRKDLIGYLEDIVKEDLSWTKSSLIDTGQSYNHVSHE